MTQDYIDSYYARTRLPGEEYHALDHKIDCEVCVIGGGLAGLATALGLVERGKSVVLLEARRIGWGASGRNGGFVTAGSYALPTSLLIRRQGLQHARQLYRMNVDAWDLVGNRIEQYDMQGVDRREGSFLPSWFQNDDDTRRSQEFMSEKFDRQLDFVTREEVQELTRSPRYYAGLKDDHFFQFHPLNYCLGLGRAITRQGGQLFEQSAAIKLHRELGGFRIATAKGSVSSGEVVMALGGYQTNLAPELARAVLPIATYVMATEPIPDDKLSISLNTHRAVADDKFSTDYYRRVSGNQILWGGRISSRLSEPKRLDQVMLGDLAKVYPNLQGTKPQVAWMGTMSYAGHRMPQIGHTRDGIWYAQAFGGSGMVATTLAGELIAQAISGEDDRYKQFEPFGIPWAGGPFGRLAAQLTYWAYQTRDAVKTAL